VPGRVKLFETQREGIGLLMNREKTESGLWINRRFSEVPDVFLIVASIAGSVA
jgi:hypothetical protein